jgi:multiple sugar transport system substrate-binding protein
LIGGEKMRHEIKLKKIASFLALGLLVGLVPANSANSASYVAPSSKTKATISMINWGDPGDDKVYAAAVARFNKKFPNVKVKSSFVTIKSWPDYIDKLVASVAAGNPPDVINIAIEGFRLGESKGLWAPLDRYAAGDKAKFDVIMKPVAASLKEPLTINGSLKFLPNTFQQMLIYYNTKLFKEAGVAEPTTDWTWSDFLSAAQKLTKGEGADKTYGFAIPFFNFGLSPWFFSNGTAGFAKDLKTPTFSDPKMVESVTFLNDLVNKYKVSPNPAGVDPYGLFGSGKVAMTGAGHWLVNGYKAAGFKDWNIAPWPKKTTQATVYGISGFGIYKKSKNQDLAWELLKELASPTTQASWAKLGGGNPASADAAKETAFSASPPPLNSERYYGALKYAKAVQSPAFMNVVEPALIRALSDMFNGSLTPKLAMDQVQKEMLAASAASK